MFPLHGARCRGACDFCDAGDTFDLLLLVRFARVGALRCVGVHFATPHRSHALHVDFTYVAFLQLRSPRTRTFTYRCSLLPLRGGVLLYTFVTLIYVDLQTRSLLCAYNYDYTPRYYFHFGSYLRFLR